MPFGLKNTPFTFQRMMDQLVGQTSFVKIYLDDAVVFSRAVDEPVAHIEAVLRVKANHGFKLKIIRCKFAKENVSLLGHIWADL